MVLFLWKCLLCMFLDGVDIVFVDFDGVVYVGLGVLLFVVDSFNLVVGFVWFGYIMNNVLCIDVLVVEYLSSLGLCVEFFDVVISL